MKYFYFAQLVQRILEAHANLKELTLMESKMNYIKAWQSLPEFGISLFVVKFMGHKKEELLGIAYNRLMRMDIATGDHIKTWRYNTMKVRCYYGAFIRFVIKIIFQKCKLCIYLLKKTIT